MSRLLDDDEISRALEDLPGWSRDGDTIRASYRSPAFLDAIGLVTRVADEAEQMNHHPDIDIRWTTTTWGLSTHDAGGLTQLDVELAHRIAQAAAASGATPDGG
ncbi:4a-hydroxytetrahydrobiopterin dehydratase [Agilicoccus flavus]|uniref:4a-hydroxytetrahydrobiopterin dehydratase n=1 Tax=Agilicoccus flavus TaxID=2775968 RepID=UPI001CF6DF91|nr:4a-hydroxytetrahydrobiopterin dehydratase [Agilicoccus flavus]